MLSYRQYLHSGDYAVSRHLRPTNQISILDIDVVLLCPPVASLRGLAVLAKGGEINTSLHRCQPPPPAQGLRCSFQPGVQSPRPSPWRPCAGTACCRDMDNMGSPCIRDMASSPRDTGLLGTAGCCITGAFGAVQYGEVL